MSTSVQHAMARLRTKMLFAAKLFPDYNFRSYFVRHVRDQFAAMERWSVEEQQQFLRKEGNKKLNEMRRMAITNRMYASQPVFLDKRRTSNVVQAQAEKK
ncbi:Complex 1 LYR protein [Trypanosoma melophagium]|uniref:Complex 1 LYR protein n=1 Tax=Trypanosoma melophagium TaxID=715481 RepID=UPI00351A6074|nr:Complex 1 LYR protein [Trypanosoma melophagium]